MAENLHTVDSDNLIYKDAGKINSVNCLHPEPLSFYDLPNEILGEIVGELDLVSRLKTRKVSRTLRSAVDKQYAHYNKIRICTVPNQINFHFDDVRVHYKKRYNGCSIEYGSVTDLKQKYVDGDYLEIALNDLAIALKKPKFQLMELYLDLDEYSHIETEQVLNYLKSLKSPIHAKKVQIFNRRKSDTLEFLSLIQPGMLEEICVDYTNEKIDASRLVNMDQWKHAKIVIIDAIVLNIKNCLHFKSFDIHVDDSFSAEDVIFLRDTLSKSTVFEYCYLMNIDGYFDVEEIAKTLGATEDLLHVFDPTAFHRHPIPGSVEFLDFNINRHELIIKRKL